MGITGVFPKPVFTILGLTFKNTVVQTWIIVAVLVGLGIWASKRFRVWEPESWQLLIEYLIEYVDNLVKDQCGRSVPEILPYLTVMIAFVAICNLAGLFPMMNAPTRDINTTAALSLVSLVSTQYFGIKKRGVGGWLHSYVEPNPVMLPMNLLSMFSRVLSMALRLFGNVIAGEVISAVFFMLIPVLSPLPMNLLGMLTSVLQALVFTVLTLVFILDAMGPEPVDGPPAGAA